MPLCPAAREGSRKKAGAANHPSEVRRRAGPHRWLGAAALMHNPCRAGLLYGLAELKGTRQLMPGEGIERDRDQSVVGWSCGGKERRRDLSQARRE